MPQELGRWPFYSMARGEELLLKSIGIANCRHADAAGCERVETLNS